MTEPTNQTEERCAKQFSDRPCADPLAKHCGAVPTRQHLNACPLWHHPFASPSPTKECIGAPADPNCPVCLGTGVNDYYACRCRTAPPSPPERCPDALPPDGSKCPRCGGHRAPSGVGGGSWVHFEPAQWNVGDEAVTRRTFFGTEPDHIRVHLLTRLPNGWIVRGVYRHGEWPVMTSELERIPPIAESRPNVSGCVNCDTLQAREPIAEPGTCVVEFTGSDRRPDGRFVCGKPIDSLYHICTCATMDHEPRWDCHGFIVLAVAPPAPVMECSYIDAVHGTRCVRGDHADLIHWIPVGQGSVRPPDAPLVEQAREDFADAVRQPLQVILTEAGSLRAMAKKAYPNDSLQSYDAIEKAVRRVDALASAPAATPSEPTSESGWLIEWRPCSVCPDGPANHKPHCKLGHPISDWTDSRCPTCESAPVPIESRQQVPCWCNVTGYSAAYGHCGCDTCKRKCAPVAVESTTGRAAPPDCGPNVIHRLVWRGDAVVNGEWRVTCEHAIPASPEPSAEPSARDRAIEVLDLLIEAKRLVPEDCYVVTGGSGGRHYTPASGCARCEGLKTLDGLWRTLDIAAARAVEEGSAIPNKSPEAFT